MTTEQNCQHLIDVPVLTQANRYIDAYGIEGDVAADKALELEPCPTYGRKVWAAVRTAVAIDRRRPTPTQP
jgi:hypothetical protein